MTVDDVIEHFGRGSVSETARRLGVHRQAVYWWKRHGITPRTQEWIEHRSGGFLSADTERTGVKP